MKKFLLLAALAASMNVMAQEVTLTDITPAAYDWANQPVGTKMVVKHAVGGWQTDFTFSYTLGGSEYLENGGCISANTDQNPADPTIIENGTAVVDLGEGIGKVMCINGANSKAKEVLGFTTDASINSMMQINIFTNPDNTPRQQWIRCKLVLNIFSNTISTTDGVISNMYFMDADNNDKGSFLQDKGSKVNSSQFVLLDEEGDPEFDQDENYIYDKNRWLTYEIDIYNIDKFKGDTYEGKTSKDMPMKWKMYMPWALVNSTVFIKELKFYAIDGYTDDKDEANYPPYANKPHLTYGSLSGSTDGIQGVEKMRNAENEKVYNLAGQRVNKAQKGIYIVNGKKIIK